MLTVYTAIIGTIDPLWSLVPGTEGGARYVCFTDRARAEVPLPGCGKSGTHWEQIIVTPQWDARRTARHYKALPDHYLSGGVFIWMDGNVRLRATPEAIVARYLRNDLATFKHPRRKDVYQEAQACIELKKDAAKVLQRQVRAYAKAGHPAGWGLAETRVVIRRNTARIAQLNAAWWEQLLLYSIRDQVSFPFVCWQLGITWDVIPGRCRRTEQPDFIHIGHAKT